VQATEVYNQVLPGSDVANSHYFADLLGNRMVLAREQLPEEVFQAAEQRGLEGDLFDVLGRLVKEIDALDGAVG
jgi:hypothetical protein